MSRRFVLVMLIALVLGAMIAGTALAQTPTTKQVGLVIAFPDGTKHLEIVTVPAAATTFDVLQEAKITLASADGGYGPGVCGINNVGCPATNCFCDAAHYLGLLPPGRRDQSMGRFSPGRRAAYVPANGAVVGLRLERLR